MIKRRVVPPQRSVFLALGWILICSFAAAYGGGVTVVTHGFGGNVDGWVTAMCSKIAQYPTFPGTNASLYKISITQPASGVFAISQSFLDGVPPDSSDSGEILVALDWSTISTGSASATAVASNAAVALLLTNLVPELHGHALAEFPLHLAGHSRGGSVVTEMARYLGARGVWVDQVTTLDPHPVTLFGDPGAVKIYANVLFADNYWQNMGDNLFVPNGQPVSGAYNRHLTNLEGGDSSSHTDVHLWYHGTIDLATPASDTGDTITEAERTNWWTSLEARGTNSGFLYSRIGEGNRFSTLEPAGPGNGRIIDGFNNRWDLGAGTGTNRVALPINNGSWPNLMRLDVNGTNQLTIGQGIPVAYYVQFGSNTSSPAQVRFYLDRDLNPLNTNQVEIAVTGVAATGVSNIFYALQSLSPDPTLTPPGTYGLLANITYGTHSRFLYAPEPVILSPASEAPLLLSPRYEGGAFQFAVAASPWQTVVIEASGDLANWTPLQTNVYMSEFVFADPAVGPQRFYRAVLRQ